MVYVESLQGTAQSLSAQSHILSKRKSLALLSSLLKQSTKCTTKLDLKAPNISAYSDRRRGQNTQRSTSVSPNYGESSTGNRCQSAFSDALPPPVSL
ncbi:hypothetical protein AOLI_G00012770 [Acnodon oligacanthus]